MRGCVHVLRPVSQSQATFNFLASFPRSQCLFSLFVETELMKSRCRSRPPRANKEKSFPVLETNIVENSYLLLVRWKSFPRLVKCKVLDLVTVKRRIEEENIVRLIIDMLLVTFDVAFETLDFKFRSSCETRECDDISLIYAHQSMART